VSEISVTIDDRVRLVAAVLAAGSWPAREQALEPHAVHPQAKLTRGYVSDFPDHPAVVATDRALDDGVPVDSLFATALRSRWPTFEPLQVLPNGFDAERWLSQLADFYTDSAIAAFFWADHKATWHEAKQGLDRIFDTDTLSVLLAQLTGRPAPQDLVIVPNLVYPALCSIVAAAGETLYLIMPPPRAVGESPPWSYGEDRGWVLAESCRALATFALSDTAPELSPDRRRLLTHATVTLFLETAADEAEALAYLTRVKKQSHLAPLGSAVDVLRNFLHEPGGRSLADLDI
jgi:hypothetical protein